MMILKTLSHCTIFHNVVLSYKQTVTALQQCPVLQEEQLFWKPTTEVRSQRLQRFTVPVDEQGEFESEHLWQHVSAAIARDDQVNSVSDLLSVTVRLVCLILA